MKSPERNCVCRYIGHHGVVLERAGQRGCRFIASNWVRGGQDIFDLRGATLAIISGLARAQSERGALSSDFAIERRCTNAEPLRLFHPGALVVEALHRCQLLDFCRHIEIEFDARRDTGGLLFRWWRFRLARAFGHDMPSDLMKRMCRNAWATIACVAS